MMAKTLCGALAMVTMVAATPAQSALVEWNFTGVFADFSTVNGSFRYDTDTMMFSSIDVDYSGGLFFGPINFTVLDSVFSEESFLSLYPDGTDVNQDLTGTANMLIVPITSFGDLNQLSPDLNFSTIGTCADSTCDQIGFPDIDVVQGTLTGEVVSVSAPPAVLGLALPGLGVMAWHRRKAA